MLSRSQPLIALLLVPALSGCWINPGLAIVKPASARAAWTGTLVPVELYGKEQQKFEAVALRVESGPDLVFPKSTPGMSPVGEEAILVDRSGRVVDRRRFQTGARVEVTGLMKLDWIESPKGDKLTRDPAGLAWHYFTVHPERLRPLGEIARE